MTGAYTRSRAKSRSAPEFDHPARPTESSRHTRESADATAEAETHGAMPHSSDAASTASTRRGVTNRSDGPRMSKADGTDRADDRPAPGHLLSRWRSAPRRRRST